MPVSRGLVAAGVAGLLLLASPSSGGAALALEAVLTGLSRPLYLTSARDGTNRLFVVEQAGRILVLQPGQSAPSVFLDITARVLAPDGSEQGLLGLAFHPQYPTNRRFFVNYTRVSDGATVIAEYLASAADPNLADATETVLLSITQPFANHNGGMVEFGPDGFLYIATGDGGSANDPGNRAQNTDELLGKILRIDVDTPSGALPYSSPPGNPFFGTAGRDEIFALGFRNPFRFSFDRGGSRELLVGDVGQGAREEIDIVTAGENHGWRIFEGSRCTGNDPPLCAAAGLTPPIAEYDNTGSAGGRCSVIGGYVYRGNRSAVPPGAYIFGDFCTGEILQLLPAARGGTLSVLLDTTLRITSFGEDEAGELYVLALDGSVQRLASAPDPPAPPSGGGDGGGGCFIATAAYGSAQARELVVLRRFRDRFLLPGAVGRSVVAAYYRSSPPLARLIAQSDARRAIARAALTPVIWWADLSLASPWAALLLAGGTTAGGAVLTAALFRRAMFPQQRRLPVGQAGEVSRAGPVGEIRAQAGLLSGCRGGRVRELTE